jgi:hypothetical protein
MIELLFWDYYTSLKNSNFFVNNLYICDMKILLDIPDNKAASLLEVLRSISYVKAKPVTDAKAQLIAEIKEAVDEMKLIRAGEKKARNAEDFLNEL